MCNSTRNSGPFTPDEGKLRAALRAKDRNDSIAPFDPITISADELHRLVDDCLGDGIIARPNKHASLAVYPLAMSEPEPILSVNPGLGGPQLLGGNVALGVGDASNDIDATLAVVTRVVDQANRLIAEAAHSYRGLLSCLA